MNKYSLFNKFVIRIPLLKYQSSFFKNINNSEIIRLLEDNNVIESIFLASPELYKIISKELSNNKLSQKTLFSVLKYISRMSTRCTPFGIFAGVSIGYFNDSKYQIFLNNISNYKNHVQLDMNILFSIIQEINKDYKIRKYFKFYPNTSISDYSYNETIKYIEYVYKDGIRNHLLTSVANSYYLELILKNTIEGKKINELVNLLEDEGIEKKDAYEFINDLIDSQILISELEPYTTGEEPLDFIIKKIQNIPELNNVYFKLKDIKTLLLKLSDFSPRNKKLVLYHEINDILHNLNIQFQSKYIFQSNLNISLKSNFLSNKLKKDITKAILIINKLTPKRSNHNLEKFKKKFYERYQDQEVSLLEVLDVDNGIGYADIANKTSSPLLDELNFLSPENNNLNLSINNISSYFTYRLTEALLKNEKIIQLTDKELTNFNEDWEDLPLSISSIIELYKNQNNELILFINGCSGSSAGNLLSRFCNSNLEINNFVTNEIIKKEDELLHEDFIFAEIIHLPESRIGNILLRPQLRKYEIPYLAKSNLPINKQINLSDIFVSVKNNQVYLRSKINNKYIVPRLTSAHNYNSPFLLNIYRFLCDLQGQNIRNVLGFNWGNIYDNCIFFPRIQYKNIIISKSCWKLKKIHIEYLYKLSDEELTKEIGKWKDKYSIPNEVTIQEADNKLYINFDNILYIKLFLKTLQNKGKFTLEEFLFSEYDSIVKNKNGDCYTNEFIFSLYKN